MKKCLFLILSIVILFTCYISFDSVTVYANDEMKLSAKSYIVMDSNTGKVLESHNSNTKYEVASICKLMTVYIVLDRINSGSISLEDSTLASKYATSMEGSRAYLDNEYYTIEELLKSVIIASANDSAVVLAEYMSGSEDAFVKLMNDTARSLGMNNTRYANATGLPKMNQYSTAYDTAIILNKLSSNHIFIKYSTIWMDKLIHDSGRETSLVNTNRLLKYYESTICGKTGFTDEAGYCLASIASKNDMMLTTVVLGCKNKQDRFSDSVSLYEYVFNNYYIDTLLSSTDDIVNDIKVNKGTKNSIRLSIKEDIKVIQNKTSKYNYVLKYDMPYSIKAPIKANDIIGRVDLLENGIVIHSYDIISREDIAQASYVDYIKDIVNRFGQNT